MNKNTFLKTCNGNSIHNHSKSSMHEPKPMITTLIRLNFSKYDLTVNINDLTHRTAACNLKIKQGSRRSKRITTYSYLKHAFSIRLKSINQGEEKWRGTHKSSWKGRTSWKSKHNHHLSLILVLSFTFFSSSCSFFLFLSFPLSLFFPSSSADHPLSLFCLFFLSSLISGVCVWLSVLCVREWVRFRWSEVCVSVCD